MTKSLGQVAYEAYCMEMNGKVPEPVGHRYRGWQAAAVAVAVKVLREQPNVIVADHELHPDAKQVIMENTRKHNAVIEAAKALRKIEAEMPATKEAIDDWSDRRANASDNLCVAVEALEEVSRGE